MVARTITTTVAEDGTVHLPEGAARPGDTVVVHIENPTEPRPIHAMPGHDLKPLTKATADTPEKRELLIQQTLEMGRRIRAQMSKEDLEFDHDAWLYDENGLPH